MSIGVIAFELLSKQQQTVLFLLNLFYELGIQFFTFGEFHPQPNFSFLTLNFFFKHNILFVSCIFDLLFFSAFLYFFYVVFKQSGLTLRNYTFVIKLIKL